MPSDRKEETREAPSDPEEETREAPWNPDKHKQETPSDFEEETKNVAGLAAGSTDLEGLVVPARRKFIISGNLQPNNIIAHVESRVARRRERSGEEGDEESEPMCDGEGYLVLQRKAKCRSR